MTMADGARGSVSCIVPVFNGEAFVAEALESILAQTWSVDQIIVVDDGSTDATPAVLDRFRDRVEMIRQPKAGPAAARNAGLELARGEWIGFLDADDTWLPGKLEAQMNRLAVPPPVDLCFCGIVNYRPGTNPGDAPTEWPQSPFSPCTLVTRRSLFDLVGTFDPDLRSGEDTDWFLRIMMRGIPYAVLPEILVRRRQHQTNLTRTDPPSQERLLRLVKMTLDKKRTEGW